MFGEGGERGGGWLSFENVPGYLAPPLENCPVCTEEGGERRAGVKRREAKKNKSPPALPSCSPFERARPCPGRGGGSARRAEGSPSPGCAPRHPCAHSRDAPSGPLKLCVYCCVVPCVPPPRSPPHPSAQVGGGFKRQVCRRPLAMSRSGDRTSTFDPSHSDNLLHGLNLLWRKQLFCDVTLTAQGQQFHCHKAVLASCSQYFRSLFSSGGGSGGHPHALGLGPGAQDGLGGPPKEPPPPQTQEEPGTPSSSPEDKLLASPRAINNLVLQGCSSIGLRLVLEYLYTANVTLSLDTVEEVLSVSKILHIPQVTKLCVQFLNDQISVQNYKQVCKIAALHGLEETKKLANKYLVEDVLLLNFEEMRALLDSLPPPVESELALFQMSVLWLEHDRETRMQYAPDLMKRLRFALIPAPELVERVQSVDFMRTDPVCQKLLLDAMNYHLMPFRQHCRQSLASRIRSNKKMLLLVGGLPPGPDRLPSNLVQYYDDEKKTWKILTTLSVVHNH
ncbi:kelch-like protein 14 isoform 3-T3 [Cyanocitta cristata]